MKIIYIAHNHPPKDAPLKNIGGMQRVSMKLLAELEKKGGVDVVPIVQQTAWKGIGIKTFFFLLKLIFDLPRLVRKHNADVILFSSMVTASLSFFTRGRIDIPMVTINHGQDVTLPASPYQWFVPKVFDSLDGVISVSRATKQACIERGMNPQKGVALGNGFEMDRLDQFPDKQIARKQLSRQFDMDLDYQKMLLTVGRQVKRKGHEWFIRNVFPLLDEDIIYVVIGDGPESSKVEKARAESDQSSRIFLLGRQPESILKQAYAAADLFIMPNVPVEGDMEGFGIVMLEANMAQTPAVASSLEGIKDVVQDGKNGYLVPPLDENAFREQISDTLNTNLPALSKRTRTFVKSKFSWEHVSQKYLDYLDEVIRQYKTETDS